MTCGKTSENINSISILTVVRNGAPYIKACLDNVMSQDCEYLHEHLIMDGASTDGTKEILASYVAKYPKLRYYSESDKGQSHAMNKGIERIKSDILGILNVDDFYEPDTIRCAGKEFVNSPRPSLIVGNCRVLGENDCELYIDRPSELSFFDLVRKRQHPCNPSAYFYHKELHNQIGEYDEDDHFAMDMDFILKAVQIAHTRYVDKIWGNYRKIEGTKTYCDQDNGSTRRLAMVKKHLSLIPAVERLTLLNQLAPLEREELAGTHLTVEKDKGH